MSILRLTIVNTDKPAMEVAAFVGDKRRVYLYGTIDNCEASGNLVTNSGAIGTTDWVDGNSDGLADDWTANYSSATMVPTISTGNGFSGNAQKSTSVGTASLQVIKYSTPIIPHVNIKVTFYYRSSTNINVIISDSTNTIYWDFGTFSANTSNAISAVINCTMSSVDPSDVGYIGFGFYNAPTIGDWFEIDNVVVTSEAI